MLNTVNASIVFIRIDTTLFECNAKVLAHISILRTPETAVHVGIKLVPENVVHGSIFIALQIIIHNSERYGTNLLQELRMGKKCAQQWHQSVAFVGLVHLNRMVQALTSHSDLTFVDSGKRSEVLGREVRGNLDPELGREVDESRHGAVYGLVAQMVDKIKKLGLWRRSVDAGGKGKVQY
jgi:hypothetical protein